MGLNTSALNQYVDQNKKDILTNFVQGANTFAGDFLHVEEGVEAGTKRELKFLGVGIEYQTDPCATASGNTTFTKKEVTSKLFVATDSWCATDADLKQKFPAAMKAGASGEMTEEVVGLILDEVGKVIRRDVAHTVWAGGYANSNDMDSFITGYTQMLRTTYSGDVFGIATAGGYTGHTAAPTAANIIDQLKALILDIPENLIGLNMEIRVSGYVLRLINAAMFDLKHPMVPVPNSTDAWTLPLDGNIVIRRDDGLAGVKAIVCAPAGELVYVNDLSSSVEKIEFWHDIPTNKQGYRVMFAIGTQVKFAENCGLITWA